MSACRREQLDSYLSPCKILKANWIKDLNIKQDALNLIEEKVKNTLEHTVTEENFLNRTSIAEAIRSPINKWN